MDNFNVTFETKCYENDWEILLKTRRLENMIHNNKFPFKERVLYINNVSDYEKVSYYAEIALKKGIITSYVKVSDYSSQALDFFGIDPESFRGGYYYSIQELVGIYLCKTNYLLHFSSDSMADGKMSWIESAIRLMEADERVKVANCLWNKDSNGAKAESLEEQENFYLGYGFSDQCYLIRTNDFKLPIYNEYNKESERYPKYGGELFEKRVDAWMRNKGYLRGTYKHGSYIHKNFPKNKFCKTIYSFLGFYDK